MATDFSNYRDLENRFNERYGVKFRYEDYEDDVIRSAAIETDYMFASSNLSEENQKYLSEFIEIFDAAFTRAVDRKIEPFGADEILKDYRELMEGYREARKKSGDPVEEKFAPSSLLLKEAYSEIMDSLEGKQDFIEEEYLGRNLRIRDMRAYMKELEAKKETRPEKLSAIWNYANALEKINAGRPGWWRIIFFARNRAEQREAQNMRNFVNTQLREYDKQYGEGSGFEKMRDCLRDSTIKDLKESTRVAYLTHKQEEKAAKQNGKPKAGDEELEKNNEPPQENEPSLEEELVFDDDVREKIGDMIENDLKHSLIGENGKSEMAKDSEKIEKEAPSKSASVI